MICLLYLSILGYLIAEFKFLCYVDWTSNYPSQDEILAYIHNVAHKYNLYKKARFSTHVQSLQWNENKGKWNVQIIDKSNNKPETLEFQYV